MAENRTAATLLEKARQLTDARMAAIEKVAEARAAQDEADRVAAAAYQAALRVWSEDELKQLGVTAPARRAPGRPRSRGARGQVEPDVSVPPRVRTPLEREAAASVALDRDQTHVVGEPVGAGT